MSEDNKNMFVMKRAFNVSGFGYGVEFKKDVPTFVPPLLHTEAMRCGAVALDADSVEHVKAAPIRQAEAQGETRIEAISRAMDTLVKKNERMSFGADGLPTLRAIHRMTGIDLEINERNSIWKDRVTKLLAEKEPSNLTITQEEKAEIAADAVEQEDKDVTAAAEKAVAKEEKKPAAPKKKAAKKKTAS